VVIDSSRGVATIEFARREQGHSQENDQAHGHCPRRGESTHLALIRCGSVAAGGNIRRRADEGRSEAVLRASRNAEAYTTSSESHTELAGQLKPFQARPSWPSTISPLLRRALRALRRSTWGGRARDEIPHHPPIFAAGEPRSWSAHPFAACSLNPRRGTAPSRAGQGSWMKSACFDPLTTGQ